MSEDEIARMVAAAKGLKLVEMENVVIESPNLKTEKLDREIGSPPGFNYMEERDEESLQVRFGGAVLCENASNLGQIDELIAKRRSIFPKARAKNVHLTMINFNLFPFDKIEVLIDGIEFEKLHVTLRGTQADPSLLAFIARHADKEVTLTMEDSLLDECFLAALPPLYSINAYWLSGFRGAWADEQALGVRDFIELVRIGHANVMLPVSIDDERLLLELVKIVAASEKSQRVTLRIRKPLRDNFHSLIGLKCDEQGDWEVDTTTGFSINDSEDSTVLKYRDTTIKMRWALTRKEYGPGSMQFYFVFIEHSV